MAERTGGPHGARGVEERLHGAALRALELTPADRASVLEGMFTRRRRDAVTYWLQLLLSMGIATVGLVLGSTAVVIGAMLIAPLMGPIVELGMGLVVGSPVLTLRSFGRMAGSVLATIAGAAVLTMLLPFQEVTSEISTRTSPTALDLLLAVFVAVAAAFTTARSGSETTSAAAGTAIGIALVPPVCVIGFGLGIRDGAIAGGATLLFLTNLTAILLVSVLFFWVLGFETVDSRDWEAAAIAGARPNGWMRRAVGGLHAVFGSRYGRVVRVGLPLLLVAAVFFPLSRALEQVAWEVRSRSAVSRILDASLKSRSAVQTQVSVQPGAVSVQLYLVGSPDDAAVLERELVSRIAAATGVVPAVGVVSVPDAAAMRQAAGREASAAPPPPSPPALADARDRIGQALRAVWPAAQLGPVLGWRLELPDSAAPRLVVEHLGPPAGAAAEALLGQSVSEQTGSRIVVGALAYAPEAAAAPASGAEGWLPAFEQAVAAVRATRRLHACVRIPAASALGAPAMAGAAARVRAGAAAAPDGRVQVQQAGDEWSVRYSAAPCAPPAPPADSAAA